MPDRNPLPHLLDIRELAEHLGVTERHVRRLIAERRIPYLRWGYRIRFDPDDVARWLEAARVAPLRESGLLRNLDHHPLPPARGRGTASR
jgi:excisionase family DNA binding protein